MDACSTIALVEHAACTTFAHVAKVRVCQYCSWCVDDVSTGASMHSYVHLQQACKLVMRECVASSPSAVRLSSLSILLYSQSMLSTSAQYVAPLQHCAYIPAENVAVLQSTVALPPYYSSTQSKRMECAARIMDSYISNATR
jgi:hypothetical protein